MITLKEQEMLEAVYQGSKKTQMDIHSILGRVSDDELALDLNYQAAAYSRIQERARDALLDSGILPASMGFLERGRHWAGVQASTALNASTRHIASLIQETQEEGMKRVGRAMEGASVLKSEAYELAEEYRQMERRNLQVLNVYRG